MSRVADDETFGDNLEASSSIGQDFQLVRSPTSVKRRRHDNDGTETTSERHPSKATQARQQMTASSNAVTVTSKPGAFQDKLHERRHPMERAQDPAMCLDTGLKAVVAACRAFQTERDEARDDVYKLEARLQGMDAERAAHKKVEAERDELRFRCNELETELRNLSAKRDKTEAALRQELQDSKEVVDSIKKLVR